jgi:two-component system nitrogen regulation response regulator GlnG
MSHVLIVDDEPSICWGFRELLTEDGHDVSIASSAEEALDIASQTTPDAVILDVRLPGRDGLSAIKDLRDRVGDAPIIVVTAFGNLETAVRAVEQGAYDYLAKPFDLEQAAEILRRALRRPTAPARDSDEPAAIARDEAEAALRGTLIGSSLAMQAIFKQIALVAASDVPVLITGESGTGKELVAQAIHAHGRRRAAPFLPICLAALSPGVLESELFGHVRGAFTGADRDRQGLLELADGGTVLLDEIGDVPLPVQVKLLRAIEQREVTPVGQTRPRHSDFRVLAATNRRLAELVARGEFREDLYYRLGVFHIHLPPLRTRTDDIPLLAAHFLKLATDDGASKRLSKAAIAELVSRPWRGNVRELRNAVERAAVVARGDEVEPEHFPPASPILASAAPSLDSQPTLDTQLRRLTADWTAEQRLVPSDADPGDLYERFLRVTEPGLLKTILAQCGNNRAAAARILGIHRATLRQKLRDHGLDDAHPGDV